ncbi:tetratricopeptide repeat protein [Psychromonas antarctica]|uniref:tetratricopeptide repeat protein n=1 Tax=Psychromonas antarctica TaxID=67573 RepID=UPI001EE8B1D3|nr:tetratricopeptide repeat protein [Psychromonas antarctica]MCG6200831.1 tetratricopeptide repeat protein [Psychromonas antarctica]
MNLIKQLPLICLPFVLLACATRPTVTPISQPTTPLPEQTTRPTDTAPVIKQVQPSPVDNVAKAPAAVISLLKRAEQQTLNGNNSAAQASLERAIRIAPRYPESYYRLGELHYQQGSYALARSLAQKTLSLGADGWLRKQALKLVEQASLDY